MVSKNYVANWPLLSWLLPLFQTESSCRTIYMKMCPTYRLIFHMKGFVLGLILKQRHKVTWKWLIQQELV